MPSRGPTRGRNCSISPPFSRVPNKGTKLEVATLGLPSQGHKRGRNCYVTPAFSGVPNKGEKIRSGYLTPTFLGDDKRAEVLCNPCNLGGPQQRV